jgi:hypothetical protein
MDRMRVVIIKRLGQLICIILLACFAARAEGHARQPSPASTATTNRLDAATCGSLAKCLSELRVENTLSITEPLPLGAGAVTLPESLVVEIGGAGVITGAGTLNILSAFAAPPRRVFDKSVKVSFVGNKLIPAFYPEWWGAKADYLAGAGTDNAPLFNAMFAAIDDHTRVETRAGGGYGLLGPVVMYRKVGIDFGGTGSAGGASNPGTNIPAFYPLKGFTGEALLDVDRSRDLNIHDFGFYGLGLVNRGIWVEQINGPGPGISSYINFHRLSIENGSTNEKWIGVELGDASAANCEFMSFDHVNFNGGTNGDATVTKGKGTNVQLSHANVKGVTFTGCQMQNFAYGIKNYQGSFSASHMRGGTGYVVYYLHNWTDGITIEEDNFEDTRQLLLSDTFGTTAPVRIRGGRYHDIKGAGGVSLPFIDFGPASTDTQVELEDNDFARRDGAAMTNLIAAAGAKSVLSAKLIKAANTPEVYLDKAFRTFGQGKRESVEGLAIWGRTETYAAASNLSLVTSTGATQSLMMRDNRIDVGGGIGITELARPSSPQVTCSNNGASTRVFFWVVPVTAAGASGQASPRSGDNIFCGDAPDASHPVSLTFASSPGAASYDIIQGAPQDQEQQRVVANFKDLGGMMTVKLTSYPSTRFGTYHFASIDETATTRIAGLSHTVRVFGGDYQIRPGENLLVANGLRANSTISLPGADIVPGKEVQICRADASTHTLQVNGQGFGILQPDGSVVTSLSLRRNGQCVKLTNAGINMQGYGLVWIQTGGN